jgi:hypothetical protein
MPGTNGCRGPEWRDDWLLSCALTRVSLKALEWIGSLGRAETRNNKSSSNSSAIIEWSRARSGPPMKAYPAYGRLGLSRAFE